MNLSACFERAWSSFNKQPAPFVIAALVLLVLSGILSFIAQYFPPIGIVSPVVNALMAGGMIIMALRAQRGQAIDVPDVFLGFQRPAPFIIVQLATLAGLLLCGVGILVTGFLFTYAMVFVARGDDFGSALTKSKDLALARPSETLLLLVVVIALNIAGALLCGVGLLVALPVSVLLYVECLKDLEGAGGAPLGAGDYGGP
jgi:hypothetical protein